MMHAAEERNRDGLVGSITAFNPFEWTLIRFRLGADPIPTEDAGQVYRGGHGSRG